MKKKIIIIVISIVCLGIVSGLVYNNFYKRDTKDMYYGYLTRIVESPDSEHQIIINIHKMSEVSDMAIIEGNINEKIQDDNGQILYDIMRNIYWAKVDMKYFDSAESDYWIEAEWIDEETVIIEGRELNIYKDRYDYRRHQ